MRGRRYPDNARRVGRRPPTTGITLPRARRLLSRPAQGLLLVAPALILIFMVLFFPALYGFYYSLFDIRFLVPGDFIGLDNYARLIRDPSVQATVMRSAVFTFFAVGSALAIGLALAVWLNRLSGLWAWSTQIVVIVPWAISAVVGALLFRWVFVSDIGLLVYVLDLLNVGRVEPLNNPATAMALLVMVACWRTLGFAVILMLSGLKSIPPEYYEAAVVDGASGWQSFVAITLPLLKTPVLITLVVLTLSNLNNVETPLITTGGGPGGTTNILPLDLYNRAFAYFDFASAISLAIGMFIANIVLVLSYVRLVRWRA